MSVNSAGQNSTSFTHQEEVIEHNINFLKSYRKGSKFEFDAQGKMHTMSWWKHLFYSRSHFEKIKEKLNTFTREIKITNQTSAEEKEAIATLFFEVLPELDHSRKFYLRDVDASVFNFLQSKLFNYPEPNHLQELSKQILNPLTGQLEPSAKSSQRPVPEPLIQNVAKTAQVWAKMGSLIVSDSGSSISYRIVEGGSKAKTLGIFKASSEEPLGAKNSKLVQVIKKFILKLMPSSKVGSLYQTAAGQGYVAEVVQYKVANKVLAVVERYQDHLLRENKMTPQLQERLFQLRQGLVPHTEVVNFELGRREKEVGSFQEWVHEEHQDAYRFLGLKNKNYQGLIQGDIPDEFMDLLAIIDYTTGNSDRHGENWFVMTAADGQNKSRVTGLRLIDGGWSMAPSHPRTIGAIELGNQYKWQSLPFANRPFTELGKFVIQELYETQNELSQEITAFYNEHLQSHEDVTTLTPHRLATMRERLNVMHQLKDSTKKELAQVRTHAQILDILRSELDELSPL